MIPLIDYLQWTPPGLRLAQVTPGPNTTNAAYSYEDIQNVRAWTDFNIDTILQRYGDLLHRAQINPEPLRDSPPPYVICKDTVYRRVTELVNPRLRRSLRAGFSYLAENNQSNGLIPLSIDCGEAASIIDGHVPDFAYFVLEIPTGEGPNRAPGVIKASWEWSTELRMGSTTQQREFHQVLSQLNWYMRLYTARYGWILTDLELVAVRRLDDSGNLEVSDAIPWNTRGNVGEEGSPRLTLLLARWYIGMLAAQEEGEDKWNM